MLENVLGNSFCLKKQNIFVLENIRKDTSLVYFLLKWPEK